MHSGNRLHCKCAECRAYAAQYRRWFRGTRLTVVTYEDGEPHERRAFIANDRIDGRRSYEFTTKGVMALAQMKEAGVA